MKHWALSMLAGTVALGDASSTQVLERLRADPAVEYVSIDRRRFRCIECQKVVHRRRVRSRVERHI